MMIEVAISDDMRKTAQLSAKKLGHLWNSIMGGKSNIYGKLGEVVVHTALGGEYADNYDYDIKLPNGIRAEVKTKGRAVPPQAHFDCTVANFNTKQDCDIYLFVSVLKNLSTGWLLGWYPKSKFYEDAKAYKTGDYDTRNNWTCLADSYSLPIDKLRSIQEL